MSLFLCTLYSLVFQQYYCLQEPAGTESGAYKAICLLSLILMIGTVTLSVFAYNFRSTPFLVPMVRNFISDYALPIGVIVFSVVAYFTNVEGADNFFFHHDDDVEKRSNL